MDQQYTATTIELDNTSLDSLKNQILSKKSHEGEHLEGDIRDAKAEESRENEKPANNKKFVFKRGDQTLELDDDYELEMMADKKPVKISLRELRERAAGDIAVKNRMHSLAEEKKKVQSTFKQFAELSKSDPLGALEFISEKAKEADSDFEYQKYIEKLADQAEKIGAMDEKERKNFELEKKLEKAEQNLSQKEREAAIVQRKQQLLETYTGIGDSQFGQMVDAVLENTDLMEGLKNEDEVMDRVEDLIQETLTQRDIMSVIEDINSDYLSDTNLIFSLSDQIRQNPDLDEEDVRDIIGQIISPKERVQRSQREEDIKVLSQKTRESSPKRTAQTPYEILTQQLKERKKEISKTPLYMR